MSQRFSLLTNESIRLTCVAYLTRKKWKTVHSMKLYLYKLHSPINSCYINLHRKTSFNTFQFLFNSFCSISITFHTDMIIYISCVSNRLLLIPLSTFKYNLPLSLFATCMITHGYNKIAI